MQYVKLYKCLNIIQISSRILSFSVLSLSIVDKAESGCDDVPCSDSAVDHVIRSNASRCTVDVPLAAIGGSTSQRWRWDPQCHPCLACPMCRCRRQAALNGPCWILAHLCTNMQLTNGSLIFSNLMPTFPRPCKTIRWASPPPVVSPWL